MMKKTLSWAAAAILALAACAREEVLPEEGGNAVETGSRITLTATHENSTGTKTALGEGGSILWTDGDRINVVYDGGNVASESLSLTAEAASATFTSTLPDGATPAYAVYPATIAAAYDGSAFTVTLPSTQDGTFAGAAVEAAPVADGNLAFKHLCGLLKVNVDAADVKAVRLTAYGGKALAGTAAITFADGIPSVGAVTGASSSITLVADGAGDYYAAVLPTDFSEGFLVELLDGSNAVIGAKFTGKRLTLQRRDLANLGAIPATVLSGLFVTVDGAGSKDGSNWDDAMDWSAFKSQIASGFTGNAFLAGYPDDTHYTGTETSIGATSGWAIYGGYNPASTGTDLSQRDIETYTTVFDGEGSKRLFVWNNSAIVSTSFDGVTFCNANASSGIGSALILQTYAKAAFNNCKVSSNNKTGTDGGGAVRVAGGNASFTDCAFANNTAEGNGGAIAVTGGTLVMEGCSFTGNKVTGASKWGSAIFAASKASSIRLNRCYFESNEARGGGTIYTSVASTTLFLNACSFYSNLSVQYASVIRNDGSVCGVFNSVFQLNKNQQATGASNFYAGGGKNLIANTTIRLSGASAAGIWSDKAPVYIVNNTIVNSDGTQGDDKALALKTTEAITSYGHNIYSKMYDANSVYVLEDATGHPDQEATVTQAWNATGHYTSWDGSCPEGFVKASPARVEAAIDAFDTDAGTAFKAWLQSLKFDGGNALQTDIRGHARSTTALWPGSYED